MVYLQCLLLTPSHLQLFPAGVDLLQGAGILHAQVDIRDGKLVCKIIDHFHPILHGGELLFEQLKSNAQRHRHRAGEKRKEAGE